MSHTLLPNIILKTEEKLSAEILRLQQKAAKRDSIEAISLLSQAAGIAYALRLLSLEASYALLPYTKES